MWRCKNVKPSLTWMQVAAAAADAGADVLPLTCLSTYVTPLPLVLLLARACADWLAGRLAGHSTGPSAVLTAKPLAHCCLQDC